MDLVTYAVLNKKIDAIGNIPDEKITAAVNTYLDENPPVTGATAEQAAQIDKNVADIGELKEDLVNVNETVTNKLYPRQDIDFYYEKDDVTVSANRRCFFPNVLIPGTYLERIDLWVAPIAKILLKNEFVM